MAYLIKDTKHKIRHMAETDHDTVCTDVADKLFLSLTGQVFKDKKMIMKNRNTHLRTIIKRCKNSILYINLVTADDSVVHSFILETRRKGKSTYYKVYNAWVHTYCLADWMLNKDGKINPDTFKNFGAYRYRDLSAESNFVDKLQKLEDNYTPGLSKELFGMDVEEPIRIEYYQKAVKDMDC